MAATKNHKHTLRSVLIFFAVFLVFFLTGFLFQFEAHAEGSKELNTIDAVNEKNAYRAFLEWDPKLKNGDIKRATVLKLIMRQGERVCLGTSVSGAPGGDILIRCQIDGKETTLNVNTTTGEGVISSRAMELAGPNYNETVTYGYKPLYFEAPYTGVYELEFHSKGPSNKNPTKKTLDKKWDNDQGASVAAWDATVLDYDGNPVKGRLFTNYIAINTGTDEVGMYSSLHVLTSEGYQYNLETNGIGPWGFILYANNVGTLKGTTGQSLYKDVILETGTLSPKGGAIVPTPDWVNKLSVLTHRIFFNDPDDAIAAFMPDFPITPTPLSEISKFQFVGNIDDGANSSKTEVGAGGIFHMTFSEHCTYDIIIDTKDDGVFDPLTDVMLPAAAAKGDNSLLWDGKDLSGNLLPAGSYQAQLRVHGGEFHFPMIDAERCPNGLKINLMNPPAFLPAGYDTTTVYYDSRNYVAFDGNEQIFDATGILGIPDPREALNGTSSSGGAMKFGKLNGASNNQFGNDRIIDIWSYILGDATDSRYQRTLDLEVVASTGTPHGSIMATVFFDNDKNGIKASSEKTMSGVSVGLYKDAAGTDPVLDHNSAPMVSVSNGRGQVTFFDVPYNNPGEQYYVLPGPVINHPVVDGVTHSVTTPIRSVTLNSANAYTDNIGLYSEHDVEVSVSASTAEITSGDEITFTIKVTNTKGFPAINTIVKIPVPNSNGEPVIVQCDQGSYANGKWTVGKLGANEEKTIVLKMNPVITESNIISPNTSETVIYKATASCDDDNDSTNNEASVSFNIKRKPEFQIIYHANYQPDAATPEAAVTENRTTVNGAKNLRKNDFSRPDYKFLGWSKIKEIAKVDYTDEASYTGTGGSVVHLYAVWKQHAPDVAITLTLSKAEIDAGKTVDLAVTVENRSDDPAKDPYVEIPFPNIEGAPVLTGTATDVFYNAVAKKWQWRPGKLDAHASVSCTLTVTPVFLGGGVQKVEIFTGNTNCTYDSVAANNTASVSVKINPAGTYEIKYEPNSGEGTEIKETNEYTTGGKKLKKNQFFKAGYTFLGWSKDSSATSPEFTDEELYKADPGSNLTLYAVWRKNPPPPAPGIGGDEGDGGGHTVSGGGSPSLSGESAKPEVKIPIFEKDGDVPDPMGADAPPVIRLMRDGFEKLFYKTETPDGIVYRAEDGEVLGYKRSRSPWTGDNAKPLLWISLMLVSAGGVAFIVIRTKRLNMRNSKVKRKAVRRKKRYR